MTTTTDTITSTWRALGTTDDVTECGHCGRTDLKGTVRMVLVTVDGDHDGEVFMGTACAARMTGRPAKSIQVEAKAADAARRAAQSAWTAARSAAFCARRDAALGPDAGFQAIGAFRATPAEQAAQAAWDAANPQP